MIDYYSTAATICKKFSSQLKLFRAATNVSQRELSNAIGISKQMVSNIEIGNKRLSWRRFTEIIIFFKKYEQAKELFSLYNYDIDIINEINKYLQFPNIEWDDDKNGSIRS